MDERDAESDIYWSHEATLEVLFKSKQLKQWQFTSLSVSYDSLFRDWLRTAGVFHFGGILETIGEFILLSRVVSSCRLNPED